MSDASNVERRRGFQLLELCRGNAGQRTAKLCAAALPHLHKHQCVAITHNQVDLAKAAAPLSNLQRKPLRNKKRECKRFKIVTTGLGGRGHLAMIFQLDRALVQPGTLYIVATPLGHARDITLRALDVLANVDRIAAEDTRVTVDLLRTHALPHRPVFSVREHNEHAGALGVIAALAAGEAVAYVSDAGTPGVSDPGARLVADVRAAGYPVIPIPGASAITALISVAGFVETEFVFIGFLPHKSKERCDEIAAFAQESRVLVFYESTHRLAETLRELATQCGERQLVIGKELTKTFETIALMPAREGPAWLAQDAQRLKGLAFIA
jgi:16S rRNA (cytidine1402-2'-O)-methyltransferase